MVFIRFDIKNQNNIKIIEMLIYGIENNLCTTELSAMLIEVMPYMENQLINEKDVEEVFDFEIEKYRNFILIALQAIKENIQLKKYEIAYDIADILHTFPDFVISNNKKEMKKYWKVYVNPFIKKWKCNLFKEMKKCFY